MANDVFDNTRNLPITEFTPGNEVARAQLDAKIKKLRDALQTIKDMTDVDNPESYRCDDREGCLDTVHAVASEAL